MPHPVSVSTRDSIDKILQDATSGDDGIPGLVDAVISKEGRFLEQDPSLRKWRKYILHFLSSDNSSKAE